MKLINDDRCKKKFGLNICSILYIFDIDFFSHNFFFLLFFLRFLLISTYFFLYFDGLVPVAGWCVGGTSYYVSLGYIYC
jgi:hypothetical protein